MVPSLAWCDTVQWKCVPGGETVCGVRPSGHRSGNTLLSRDELETLETPSEHVNELSTGFADLSWAAGCRFERGTCERGCWNTGLRATGVSDSGEPSGVRTSLSERLGRQAE
jgi:hypothetical protein